MNKSTEIKHDNLTCSFEIKFREESLINIELKKKLADVINAKVAQKLKFKRLH